MICAITKSKAQKVSPADSDDHSSLNCLFEEKTSLNLLQETHGAREPCHGDDLSSRENELPTLSPVANLIRGFKSAGVSEVVSRDSPRVPDSAKSLTYDSYRLYGQKEPLDPFRNVMSPIEVIDLIILVLKFSTFCGKMIGSFWMKVLHKIVAWIVIRFSFVEVLVVFQGIICVKIFVRYN